MKWYLGLPLCVLLAVVITGVTILSGFPLHAFVIFGSALWVAIDSVQIGLKKYNTGITYSPVVLFICVVALWLATVPWYLHVRYRIVSGEVEHLLLAKYRPGSAEQS